MCDLLGDCPAKEGGSQDPALDPVLNEAETIP